MALLTRNKPLRVNSRISKIQNSVSRLSELEQAHLQLLILNINMLADISFADVMVLTKDDISDEDFCVLGHARPINSSTVYQEDTVGAILNKADSPMIFSCFETCEIVESGIFSTKQNHWIHTLAIPINFKSRSEDIGSGKNTAKTIGVMLCEKRPTSSLEEGQIEASYFSAFRRLARMVADGMYPSSTDIFEHDHSPRVGDGLIVLDTKNNAENLSPNAHSALKRIGVIQDLSSKQIHNLNLSIIAATIKTGLPHSEEIESNGYTVILRCLPLIENDQVTGTLVLLRDITELRRRDRLLLTKDATIAEIHHRVKNNLQTISSLLQLQSRRLSNPEAKFAILESARRIRSIAIVHEILAHEISNEVRYEEIVKSLVSEVQEALISPEAPIALEIQGSAGYLSSEIASTLALITNELLQNAIEHAFVDGAEKNPTIIIKFKRLKTQLQIFISDNGIGIPADKNPADKDPADKNPALTDDSSLNGIIENTEGKGLGLTIVRTLMEADLRGKIEIMNPKKGTCIKLSLPNLGNQSK